jgi:site-specific recombinase XerD
MNEYVSELMRYLTHTYGSTMKSVRHILANILKNSGVHTGFIKGILGHESVTTTKFYLEGLDDPIHKEIMSKATALI